MKRLSLPLGVESFKEIRTNGYYYVDKTAIISDFFNDGAKVSLFTRPRCFGKTLTLSMLKSFFEIGTDKSLFDGLAVSKEKALCKEYMGKYPVISISLKDVCGSTFNEAYDMLHSLISGIAAEFKHILNNREPSDILEASFERLYLRKGTEVDVRNSLKTISLLLYRYYGKESFILIDDYDVPLTKAGIYGYHDQMDELLQDVLVSGLKGNEYLAFGILAGCFKTAAESVFTGFNNLVINSIINYRYDKYFGFTEEEVAAMLKYYGLESNLGEVKDWYDGYHFGSTNLCCSGDVVNYCHDRITHPGAEPKAYRPDTNGNDILHKLVKITNTEREREEIEKLITGGKITRKFPWQISCRYLKEPDASDPIALDRHKNVLWDVLLMTGYLTTGQKVRDEIFQDDRYELFVPNKAMRKVFEQAL